MLSRRQFVLSLMVAPAVVACSGPLGQSQPTPKPVVKAETVSLAGTSKALPLVEKIAEAYREKNADTIFKIEKGVDTSKSIYAIKVGQLDLTVTSRPPKADEADERMLYRPFIRDAVVFAVNGPYKIENLTTQQVKDIYTGKVTDWKQLGEKEGVISLLDREEGDTSRDVFLKMMGEAKPDLKIVRVFDSASEMLKELDQRPGTLGYSHLGLLRLAQPKNVKVLALDGVMPTTAALTKNTYAHSMTFGFAYLKQGSKATQRFIDFVYGPSGREIAEKYGYGLVES